MTDDIVTLLREDFCDFGQWENSCTPEGKCPCCLAADEIERLRAELERWQLIAKTLGDGYSLTAEQRPALQAVYEKFYANSPAVIEAI